MGFLRMAMGTVVTAALAAGTAAAEGYDAPVALDLAFVLHIDQDLPEQDVFVERVQGSGEVYRATKADRDMSAPLFAAAEPVEHAPFDADAVGPYPKGAPLGITLGEWFAAKGRGRYGCVDGEGTLAVTFEGLVPEGVYTLWHFFMAMPPTEPFIGTYDLPIGARDGSQAAFTADAAGRAVVERTFRPCLQLSGEHLMAGLALAYHSNGQTYGPLPGEFATDSHVHLYLGLPKRAGI